MIHATISARSPPASATPTDNKEEDEKRRAAAAAAAKPDEEQANLGAISPDLHDISTRPHLRLTSASIST